jgi:cyclopropane fatty-acyl-phospholipid synthase-like methyltransferase
VSDTDVIWHDVECGAYAADLALWVELAGEGDGAILELGCGTGRVALHLARRGHEVWGVDRDPALTAELQRRAEAEGVSVHVVTADVRELDLDARFALVAAPMQVLQMLGGEAERRQALERSAVHLTPEGLLAAAIVEGAEMETDADWRDLLPDVREADGWIYSSQPLEVRGDGTAIAIRRLRQTVSPAGGLEERRHTERLERLDAETLEAEAAAAGLRPAGRRVVEATDAHVGSTVVLLTREEP